MASQIDICNDALSELAAAPINSIDENTIEAKECKRHWSNVVAELLEAHDWSFQITRQSLAAITLDREGEWLYAYAAPSDVAKPLGMIPVYDISPGTLVSPRLDQRPGISYLLNGSTIYTNLTPASFAYVSRNPNIAGFSARFARAISMEMAARMAMALKKSRELKGDFIKQAQIALERAIADDINKSPTLTPDYLTDVEIVRDGGDNIDAALDADWRRH